MLYHNTKIVKGDFDEVIMQIRQELDKEGFGVLMVGDITMALKKQLNHDFRRYTILGACNAPYSKQIIEEERWIGTMLPCNILIQETDDGLVEVSGINPVAAMMSVDNPKVKSIAAEVKEKLDRVIAAL